ncbi:MAG: hypothetical protein WA254_22145 [Candidatus Sulfotelmatobacter sp.]
MIPALLNRASSIRCARGFFAIGMTLVGLMLSAPSMAQQAANGSTASAATVTFSLDFPQSNPEHYSIVIDTSGHARYECMGSIAEDSEDEAYQAEFQVSAANRERVFSLAKQARYFTGAVDSNNGKLAFTGTKVLSYQDGQHSNTAHYNYSNLAPVQQLTTLFQNMAATLEYGRRLAYYHRYQKLALDDELKRMQTQAQNNELNEIQSVAPVLREILEDSSVMNVVRARAKELIEMGNVAGGH